MKNTAAQVLRRFQMYLGEEELTLLCTEIMKAAPSPEKRQAVPSGWTPTDAEVSAWNDRNDNLFQDKLHLARVAIDDARSMHMIDAAPLWKVCTTNNCHVDPSDESDAGKVPVLVPDGFKIVPEDKA
jgi:hypothetical protein